MSDFSFQHIDDISASIVEFIRDNEGVDAYDVSVELDIPLSEAVERIEKLSKMGYVGN